MVVAIAADSCAACGVQLAADQRYCVECGHPRGTTRMPAFASAVPEDGAWSAGGIPAGSSMTSRSSAPWWRPPAWRSANPTVFALIGALLLAVGVGVLIGRSNSSSSAGSRVTTVFLQGPGAGVGAVTPTTAAPAAAATTPSPARGKTAATASAKKAAAAAAAGAAAAAKKAAKTPPPKAATVGSAGSGPGYQKGKFTGNFFGGG